MIRLPRSKNHRAGAAAALLAAALLLGCAGSSPGPGSRIPEFAQPTLQVDPDGRAGDWVGYRALERDDFRASAPPARFAHGAGQIGAATCAAIRARPGARFSVTRRGEHVVVAPVDLVFEALFDRSCSWWNAANATLPEAYVLEHEQIHFALFELEARRLTRRAGRAASVKAEAGATAEEAARRAQVRIDAEIDRASQEVLRRSLAFDEETSFAFVPEVQARWRERVERELAAAD